MSSIFGHDYQGRKNIPIFFFLTRYFPKALVQITKVCVAGNAQHNKELELMDINWSRGKSQDQLNTAMRHMMDHALGHIYEDEPPEVLAAIGQEEGTYTLAKAAWRVLAELELTIEREETKKAASVADVGSKEGIPMPDPAYMEEGSTYAMGNEIFVQREGRWELLCVKSTSGMYD